MKRCGDTYTYTADDVDRLGLYEDDAGLKVGPCDLVPGHPGQHVVDVYLPEEPEKGDDYVYLFWSSEGSAVRVLAKCSTCRLPAGHTEALKCAHWASRCQGQVELEDGDVRRLEELPEAAHAVSNPFACELEPGHTGGHVTLGQSQDFDSETQTLWWITWSVAGYEITEGPACDAVADPDDEDFAICHAIAGHPGAHSWI
ncbi:hypothetical protein ABZ490_40200 [Streptomyces sp. NPDC005811]|uniref:hypothetical protein n=1 Tax=Streptomyces sp. NPDC005811 TaxID=3154565 RepID=UPI0033EFE6DD